MSMWLLWRLWGKDSACQCSRHKRLGFDPWVRKIPWNRKWQPSPVFLPGKSHGWRSLAGYSPWGHKRVKHDLATKQQRLLYLFFFVCLFLRKDRSALDAFVGMLKLQKTILKINIILKWKHSSDIMRSGRVWSRLESDHNKQSSQKDPNDSCMWVLITYNYL